jgi:hypothetical protein
MEKKFSSTPLGLRRHGEEEIELSVKNDLFRSRRKKKLNLWGVTFGLEWCQQPTLK